MRDHMFRIRPISLLLMVLLSLGLVLTGCGDDDDDDNPAGPGGSSEFDQQFAAAQSQFLVEQVVSQMFDMGLFVDGVGAKADDLYTWGWVEDPGRWEGSYTGTYEGFTSSWNVWLQYLSALGEPQPEPLGAASMAYHIDASMSGSESGDGTSVSYDFGWVQNYSAAGLGTDTLLIDGDGAVDIDYAWSSDGSSGSASYSASWDIVSPGVSYPLDGCPTGSIVFTLAPFTVTVVFDGDDTATYTMRNGDTVIPEGSGTTSLFCGVGK